MKNRSQGATVEDGDQDEEMLFTMNAQMAPRAPTKRELSDASMDRERREMAIGRGKSTPPPSYTDRDINCS